MMFAGSFNPQGPEIAAGIATLTGLLALVERSDIPRRLVYGTALTAAALVTPRSLGAFWFAVALVVIAVTADRPRLRELLRDRRVRIASAFIGVVTVAAVSWTIGMRAYAVMVNNSPKHNSYILDVQHVITTMMPKWTDGTIGVFGWGEYQLPAYAQMPWIVTYGMLAILGLIWGLQRDRLRVVALLLVPYAIGTYLMVADANQYGPADWQGRYMLPLTAPVALFGAYAIVRKPRMSDEDERRFALTTTIVIPAQVWALLLGEAHFIIRNPDSLNVFGPVAWRPVFGPAGPLVLATIGAAVLFWLAVRVIRTTDAPRPTRPSAPLLSLPASNGRHRKDDAPIMAP
jgi:hypothetical protein